MESNFKVGDRVLIIPNSRFYLNNISNPKDVIGEIIKCLDYEHQYNIRVKWYNGTQNVYNTDDLMLVDGLEESELKKRIDRNIMINNLEFDESKIYLDFNIEVKDVNDLLTKLLINDEYYKTTSNLPTYFRNGEYQKLQCCVSKYRSFDDIYIICKSYFEDITIEEVIKELIMAGNSKELFKDRRCNYNLKYCSTIDRIRFVNCKSRIVFDHITANKGSSKHNWFQLLKMIGITDQKSYINFIKKHLDEKI